MAVLSMGSIAGIRALKVSAVYCSCCSVAFILGSLYLLVLNTIACKKRVVQIVGKLYVHELRGGQASIATCSAFRPDIPIPHGSNQYRGLFHDASSLIDPTMPQVCRRYVVSGTCRYGERCKFEHTRSNASRGRVSYVFEANDCQRSL